VQPGDTEYLQFKVEDDDGDDVTGLTTGSFSYRAQHAPYGSGFSNFTDASAITELGSGWYQVAYTYPNTGGKIFYLVSPASAAHHIVEGDAGVSGELEDYDLNALVANTLQSVTSFTDGFAIGDTVALEIVARRYTPKTATVKDDDGVPVDLSGYTNLRMAIRNTDGTVYWESAGAGSKKISAFTITANASGVLAISIPENLYTADTTWSNGIAISKGEIVGSTDGTLVMIAKNAGTTGGSEPTWTGSGTEVVDNDITWVVMHDPNVQLDNAVAASASNANLLYEVTGDEAGDATQTRPLVRSSALRIFREEVKRAA